MSHRLLVILNITKAIFIQNPHIGCVRDYTVLVTIGDLIEESKMDNSMVWSTTGLDKLDNDEDCLQNCISNFRIYCLHLGRYTTETEYDVNKTANFVDNTALFVADYKKQIYMTF